MQRKKIARTSMLAAVVSCLVIGSYILWKKEDRITMKDAETIIASKYDGDIVSMEQVKKDGELRYSAILENDKGIYEMEVDAQTGSIFRLAAAKIKQGDKKQALTEEEAAELVTSNYKGTLKSISQKTENGIAYFFIITEEETREITYKINRKTAEIEKITKNAAEEGVISEQKAKEIAETEVAGSVKEVELEEEDQQLVYEVEIETVDKKEVKVFVNAYSGTILSINWEDD